MSAYWKIPLQALILMMGVLIFVFYQFNAPPLLFNPAHEQRVREADPAGYAILEERYRVGFEQRLAAATAIAATPARDEIGERVFLAADSSINAVRVEALAKATEVTGEPSRDVNYVMPSFVLNHLPLGMAGIFIAAVMAAAMSSIAAELNSLSTATVIDFYQRWYKPQASDAHYLRVSKIAPAFWGVFASLVAVQAASLGSLIEVVNRFGSFFYGSILGVFLLAMIGRARAIGAFVGLLTGMGSVAAVSFFAPSISFLWHNVIGAVVVVVVGMLLSTIAGGSRESGIVNRV
jgi:Na+(H+)/acetate symporter ActP